MEGGCEAGGADEGWGFSSSSGVHRRGPGRRCGLVPAIVYMAIVVDSFIRCFTLLESGRIIRGHRAGPGHGLRGRRIVVSRGSVETETGRNFGQRCFRTVQFLAVIGGSHTTGNPVLVVVILISIIRIRLLIGHLDIVNLIRHVELGFLDAGLGDLPYALPSGYGRSLLEHDHHGQGD